MDASATKRRRQEPERLSYAPPAIPLPAVSKSDLGEATKRAAYYRICFMGKENSGGKNSWAAALAWAVADAGLEVGSLSRQRARPWVLKYVEAGVTAAAAASLLGISIEPGPGPPATPEVATVRKTVNVGRRVSPTGKLPASRGDEEYEKAYVLAGRYARENGATLTTAQARVHDELGCTISKTAVRTVENG